MNYKEIPLPEYAYIPGEGKRHPEGFLDHIKGLAPDVTTDEGAANNCAWLYGIWLFENEFYWECHEVLETVWMCSLQNSREKHLVQGIIHLANAYLKIKMKRTAASQKLAKLASSSFDEAYSGLEQEFLLLLKKKDLENALPLMQNMKNSASIMNYIA